MTTLYEKVGRRYRPVRDTAADDGLPNGSWLVVVEDGRRTARHVIDDSPVMQEVAAVQGLADIVLTALAEHCRCEYGGRKPQPLTELEQKAYRAWADIMGADATLWLTRPALTDVAARVARTIVERCRSNTAAAEETGTEDGR